MGKRDLMQVPVVNLSCLLEQAVQWRNYTDTFFTEFAKRVTVNLLYGFNACSITRTKYSVCAFSVYSLGHDSCPVPVAVTE